MKALQPDRRWSWNHFAVTLPWVAGMVTFINAIFAIKVSLMSQLVCLAVIYAIKHFVGKRPWFLLGMFITLQVLTAGVLAQSMVRVKQPVLTPWGPSLCWPNTAVLQQLGVGNWPIVKSMGSSIFQTINYYAGLEDHLVSVTTSTIILAVLSLLLLEGIEEAGWNKGASVFIVLPIYYGWRYGIPVMDSLSMFLVYLVIFNVLENNRRLQGASSSGLWAGLLTAILVMMTIGVQHGMPYERLDKQVQDWLPDVFKGSEMTTSQWKSPKVEGLQSPYYPLKSRLGGPIKNLGTAVVYKVQAVEAPLYLRGAVKTHYDGKSWSYEPSVKSKSDSAYDLKGNLLQEVAPPGVVKRLDLEAVAAQGSIILSPLGFWKTDWPGAIQTLGDGLHVQRQNTINKTTKKYSVLYTGNDLEMSEGERYLKVPNLPKLKALALRLTAGATTDAEKIKRLKDYLKTHYKYKLDVAVPPVDQDFVSFFVFNSKEGYCTYFASAMTLMARELGIPARYVEGYLLSPLKYQEGAYYITEDLAHAWTEVYSSEKGWTTVEATPAYDFTEKRTPSSIAQTQKNGAKSKPTPKVEQAAVPMRSGQVVIMWGFGSLLLVGTFIYSLSTFLITRWLYANKTREGYLRRLYYYEYLLEKKFQGTWHALSLQQKMTRYFLIETEASLVVFDDIIKTAERVLYDPQMPSAVELNRIDVFLKAFEQHYSSKTMRIVVVLNFLKGWKNIGANRKSTTP